MNYQERPKGKTSAEASLDGGQTWRRCVPVSFTAENAQKVHNGTKTQTRRLLNPQPLGDGEMQKHSHADLWMWKKRGSGFTKEEFRPRYRVGDVLWCQESWRTEIRFDNLKPTELPASARIHYEGSSESWRGPLANHDLNCGKLRPGRFLPLRFARPHRYEVVAVRCERVNAISGKDCEAEGIACGDTTRPGHRKPDSELKADFRRLWNSIHTAPGTRFEDAPWVFAYTFRKVK